MKKQAARMAMSHDPTSRIPSPRTDTLDDSSPQPNPSSADGGDHVEAAAGDGPDILLFEAAGKPVPAHDHELAALIATGRAQGYLTFDQVNSFLPDEAVDPEKIDALLVALEEKGIDLLDEAPPPRVTAASGPAPKA